MAAAPLSYAVVTPVRNERANIKRLAAALVAQRHRALAWVVVDDGSDDGTTELVAELAARHPWIHLAAAPPAEGDLSQGRRGGRVLLAFLHGVEALPGPAGVVVKADADTSFDEDYFHELLVRFAEEPDLGIAGGACYELEDGGWVRQRVSETHPRGASRAYRWECLFAVRTLEPHMGWDGVDEVKAALGGYRTRAFNDLAFRHHRRTGARERGRLRHGTAQGRAAWYMGYRPSYIVLRTLYRMPRDPGAAGMVLGYAAAAAAGSPRCPDPAVIHHIRDRQRLREAVRRGLPG
jgi:glycosyltransferase involved in cell wall biosynthesis